MGASVIVALAALGVAGTGVAVVATSDTSPASEEMTVTKVVDGDTIWVKSDDGQNKRIRLLGIDTPEVNQCGHDTATARLKAVLRVGETVTISTGGDHDDKDKYDRYLRYVTDTTGGDIGTLMIKEGYAVARYDSRDGYDKHDKEDAYRSLSGKANPTGCQREQQAEAKKAEAAATVAKQAEADVPVPDVVKTPRKIYRAPRPTPKPAAKPAYRKPAPKPAYSGNRAPCRRYNPDGTYRAIQPGQPGCPIRAN